MEQYVRKILHPDGYTNEWNRIFDGKRRNFTAFVGPGAAADAVNKSAKIRVNAKFDPWDTKITFPTILDEHRKYVIGRSLKDDKWSYFFTEAMKDVSKFSDGDVDRLLIFAVPLAGNQKSAFVSLDAYFGDDADLADVSGFDSGFTPRPSKDRSVTMNRKQRATIRNGLRETAYGDQLVEACVRSDPSVVHVNKFLFAITTIGCMFSTVAGNHAEVFDPGITFKNADSHWIKSLQDDIRAKHPSCVYSHTPFDDDREAGDETFQEYCNLLHDCESQGIKVIVADRASANRWDHHLAALQIHPCSGNLSFAVNDDKVAGILTDWASWDEDEAAPSQWRGFVHLRACRDDIRDRS